MWRGQSWTVPSHLWSCGSGKTASHALRLVFEASPRNNGKGQKREEAALRIPTPSSCKSGDRLDYDQWELFFPFLHWVGATCLQLWTILWIYSWKSSCLYSILELQGSSRFDTKDGPWARTKMTSRGEGHRHTPTAEVACPAWQSAVEVAFLRMTEGQMSWAVGKERNNRERKKQLW
jgi:hypothetical protein